MPNPENYTIIFNADGTLTGKADCNTFGGAYSQASGFTIKLGPSTMAYCGEASLDAAYLQLLSSVAAGGPDGAGNLALETAGGAQRMLFKNGGAPQAAAPSEPSANMIQPQQVSIDTQGLPYSWQANLVPATPYDASQPPGPMGMPEHIEINFGVTDPADRQPGDPIMYIIPVTAYEQMWDPAGNPSVTPRPPRSTPGPSRSSRRRPLPACLRCRPSKSAATTTLPCRSAGRRATSTAPAGAAIASWGAGRRMPTR